MLEIIIIGFVFWVGYQVGMSVTAYRLRDLVYREAKRRGLIKELDIVLEETPIVAQLIVEKSNDILYLYTRDDNTFVCQGSTLEEIASLAKKYNNIRYAAVTIDKEIYAFVDGTVKSEKEVVR